MLICKVGTLISDYFFLLKSYHLFPGFEPICHPFLIDGATSVLLDCYPLSWMLLVYVSFIGVEESWYLLSVLIYQVTKIGE